MAIKNNILILILFWISLGLSAQKVDFQAAMFTKGSDTLQYRILYPKDFSATEKYPVVLFLHGAGERGNDNEKQLTHGSALFLNENARNAFPAIVIFPQCPKEDYWSNVKVNRDKQPLELKFNYSNGPTEALGLTMALMDSLVQESFVKTDQVYVMGLSMGGMGTFEVLYRKPDMFAAAIPICGGGEPEASEVYAKKVPLWIFHGARDNVVDPRLSLDMASKVMEYGGHPNLTLYSDANHNSWDPAFKEPGLLAWLFSNRIKEE